MLQIDSFLSYLKLQKFYFNQINHIEDIPAKPARFGELDIPLHEKLMNWLIKKKILLWSHQADAINGILNGKNVIIATSTSSGKSLCYNLPVLNAILEDKEATALYIYPRKALTQDQHIELVKIMNEVAINPKRLGVYDGDTEQWKRPRMREEANIIMTNPYALHRYLPHFLKLWRSFCSHLKYIIIDEVHLYKGVFGTNVAFLIRRLKRILDTFGATPQWILSSATIFEPGNFGENLVGEPFNVVDRDGSPSGAKKVILWDLPYDDTDNTYRSGNLEARDLFRAHLQQRIQTLLFTKSRKLAELQSMWAKDKLPAIRDYIQSYRAGLSKQDRREIEQGLKERELLGVCSTNALELGIDIGTLQATITAGFPGTVSSFKQQIGRAGRGELFSISVLIPQANPLDFFYVHNPKVLFGPVREKLLINLTNKHILKNQLRCAADEMSISLDEYLKFGIENQSVFHNCLDELTQEKYFDEKKERDKPYLLKKRNKYISNERNPAQIIGIDNLSEIRYNINVITEEGGIKLLTTDDEEHVYRDIYPKAIYLYKSEQYYVEKVDFERHSVLLSKIHTHYYTISLYETEITQLEKYSQIRTGYKDEIVVSYGAVNVRKIYTSSVLIDYYNSKVIDSEDLSMPDLHYNTEALWINIPPYMVTKIEEMGFHFEGSIHGVLHALIHIIPIHAQIDQYDIDGTYLYSLFSQQLEPGTKEEKNEDENGDERGDRNRDKDGENRGVENREELDFGGLLYVFDTFKDGIGISEHIFGKIEELLKMAYKLIKKCPCTSRNGCPACIIGQRCGRMNEPLSKKGALALLELLLHGQTKIKEKIGEEKRSKEKSVDKTIKMGKSDELITYESESQSDKTLDVITPPKECPECGKKIRLIYGKYGWFFGCNGYPNCRYTLDVEEPHQIYCPLCDGEMEIRQGRYGFFLGCKGFPDCEFTFNIIGKKEEIENSFSTAILDEFGI